MVDPENEAKVIMAEVYGNNSALTLVTNGAKHFKYH